MNHISNTVTNSSCIAVENPFDNPQLMIQKGNANPIHAVAISSDGNQFLIGGDDVVVVMVDRATGREIRQFTRPQYGFIRALAFSPTEPQVISTDDNGIVTFWDIATGQLLRQVHSDGGSMRAAVFSPDGQRILTGSADNIGRLWDVVTLQEIGCLTGHDASINSVAFSPNGQRVLTGSADGTARLWDLANFQEVHRFDGHTDAVWSVAFSPDGQRVLTGSEDRSALLWDVATGQLLQRFEGHEQGIRAVTFSLDGLQVLTGSADATARLWDGSSGQEIRRFVGHTELISSLVLTPDGKQVLTGSIEKTARLWDMATGQELRCLSAHTEYVQKVAFSRDGRQMLAMSRFTVGLWDCTTGQEIRRFFGGAPFYPLCFTFSADGQRALLGGYDKTARILEIATGREVRRFEGHTDGVAYTKDVGKVNGVWAVAYSPDEKQVLTGSTDTTARLWDAETGEELKRFEGHTNMLWTVAFSPDGRHVLTGSADTTVRLWDVATGQEVRCFEGHTDGVGAVMFSPNGRQILTSGSDRTARLWDIATGQEIYRLEGHTSDVGTAVFSPDGRLVLTGSMDNTARLWDVATGREVRRMVGHSSPIPSAVFSPDGERVLTGSMDGTARLWEVASGRALCSFMSFNDGGWAVVDSSGRYDASPEGTQWLHFVKDMTPISFDQLKDGFYEPALFAKACGFNREPLRAVPELATLSLFPQVSLALAKNGEQLTIWLQDQGGGIGQVKLFLNGKELTGDVRGLTAEARGLTVDSRGLTAEARGLTVDSRGLTADARAGVFFLRVGLAGTSILPGQTNEVRVVAYNEANDLASPGASLTWNAPGAADTSPPRFFAIVAGTSDYADPKNIKSLRFAAKDARDMSRALAIGARQLFQPQNVHIRLLTGEAKPESNALAAQGGEDFGRLNTSKGSFKLAFAEVAEAARPQDTVVVYLAGHGTTIGQGESDYRYLTQDAMTADLTRSPFLNDWTLSSKEMADWMLNIKARKQVLILDTCAAGAASNALLSSRAVSSDQKRAIERAKDRAGFYALMGSAPDAQSYESSHHNQGLLTYSLLEGMRGRALREDKYVDIALWFNFAADRVPQLADNLSAIQKPEICAPRAESFDVGLVTAEERMNIPLAVAQPQVLRPRLSYADLDDPFDYLTLSAKLGEALRAISEDDTDEGGIVYTDADNVAGGVSVTGSYAVQGERISARVTLRRDGVPMGPPLVVVGDVNALADFTEQLALAVRASVIQLTAPS